jgi:hypothetical protein
MIPCRTFRKFLAGVQRGLVSLGVLSVAVGFLCSGSCYVAACSGDCCDGDCTDGDGRDDGGNPPPPSPEGDCGWSLGGFTLVGTSAPGSHPIAAILPAVGLTIARPVMGPTGHDPKQDALEVTQRVLRANPAYFALPAWAGELVPAEVRPTPEGGLHVLWAQVRGALGAATGSGVAFDLDARGRLTRIENRTRVVPFFR